MMISTSADARAPNTFDVGVEKFTDGMLNSMKTLIEIARHRLRRGKVTAEDMRETALLPKMVQLQFPKNTQARSEAQIVASLPNDRRDQATTIVRHMKEAMRSFMRMNLSALPILDPSLDVPASEDLRAMEECCAHMIDGFAVAFLLGIEDACRGAQPSFDLS